MRAARRHGVLGVVRCRTRPSKGAFSHPLFNIFFAAVINAAFTCFKADKGIMDALVHPRNKKGAWGRGEATLESQSWRRRFCTDDARIVSKSPEQLRKKMGGIVVVYAAFVLTVSEATTKGSLPYSA